MARRNQKPNNKPRGHQKQKNGSDAPGEPAAITPKPVVIEPPVTPPSHDKRNRQDHENMPQAHWLKRGTRATFSRRGLSIAVSISVIAQAVFATVTWNALLRQNDEIAKTTKATEGQLSQMIEGNKIARGQLEQMANEQRPWIVVGVPQFKEAAGAGLVAVEIPLMNYGNSPATVIEMVSATIKEPVVFLDPKNPLSGIAGFPTDTTHLQNTMQNHSMNIAAIIPPGDTQIIPTKNYIHSQESLRQVFSEKIKPGTKVHIRVKYTGVNDVSAATHTTLQTFEGDAKTYYPFPAENKMD
jgi:hypothetical protein